MKIPRLTLAIFLFAAYALRIAGSDATVTGTTTVTGTLTPPSGGGGGSPALIASVSTGGTINGVTSSAINTTGANLIVVSVSWYPASGADVTTAELSDSKGNTWTQLNLAGVISSTATANRLFYCYGGTVGTGHTFTVAENNSYPVISVLSFSNASASPLDQQSQGEQSATNTIQPGSITATQANTILVTSVGFGETGATVSINLSFNTPVQSAPVAGDSVGGGISYRIDTSATATNPTWTKTAAASHMSSSIASFKY